MNGNTFWHSCISSNKFPFKKKNTNTKQQISIKVSSQCQNIYIHINQLIFGKKKMTDNRGENKRSFKKRGRIKERKNHLPLLKKCSRNPSLCLSHTIINFCHTKTHFSKVPVFIESVYGTFFFFEWKFWTMSMNYGKYEEVVKSFWCLINW